MDDQARDAQTTGGASADHVGDVRRRPVVLRTGRADDVVPRRSARYLAWAGSGVLGLVAAAGLVAGGTAVWSAFDPGTPGRSPAPLWFPPPETITPQSERITPTPTVDDHGGDRTRTPTSSSTTEPGDDKGGTRTTTGKTTSGNTTSGKTATGKSTTVKPSSGKHGSDDSGKSGSDDGPSHN
ncbi:hypothetical protein [Kribbella pratensis]|uniref:Uncharacterized protein n=1 Tax=Kribbella pratensis TaxID=2512112 RepID=A0A4R8CKU5_9ACTN|nr:hypothetical protein [Kribbella pratensis]TDW76620.1 hypothetical protein EV653_1777 [Kribbella pratensis]